jgi:hypothetical protein
MGQTAYLQDSAVRDHQGTEGGDDPTHWVDADGLREVLADLDGWGIEQFIPGVPLMSGGTYTAETNTWPRGAVLLLEVRVIQPDADGSLS